MLENGRFGLITEIAAAEKIDRSFVSRLLRLTLLTPDIQEAILEGQQPKGTQLEELMRAVAGGVGRAAPARRRSAYSLN